MMFDFADNCRQFTAILIANSRIILYITLSFNTKLSKTSIMHPIPKRFSQRKSWAFLGSTFQGTQSALTLCVCMYDFCFKD